MRTSIIALITLGIGVFLFISNPLSDNPDLEESPNAKKDHLAPYEHFYLQRSYPDFTPNIEAYHDALSTANLSRKQKQGGRGATESWQVEGPANIGGRLNTVAVDPTNDDIIYVGCSDGGIFKTTDGGFNWNPIVDEQPFTAIGDIAINPLNPSTIYVGTGDPNVSGYPFIGDGVWKSIDAGTTWTHLGLTASRIVSKIIIHPADTNSIYVSTMGLPFERNNDRGLYKSVDGGANWSQVLFIDDQTGIADIISDPANPQVIYAAGWTRIRNNHESITYGLGSRVMKSIDGGANWTHLSNGIPVDSFSRIGLAMDGTNSSIIYVEVVDTNHQVGGVYRSTDAGNSFSPLPFGDISSAMGGFGWYFGRIEVNPFNSSVSYFLVVELWKTTHLGNSWNMASPDWWTYQVHADDHDLHFVNATTMLLATDGGLYKTTDGGTNWTDIEDIPNTQFYHVKVNPHVNEDYWGGAQDNGTTHGNASNMWNWPRTYGGDGFHVDFHPTNPLIVYAETQRGNIVVSDDGGNSFTSGDDGIDGNDRRNWDMPYIVSPHDPNTLYSGTYRVYKSTAGWQPFWNPLSFDLTDGDLLGGSFNTITTLRESPLTDGLLFAGTSDGNVWRSTNGGLQWDSIHHNGLPNRYITDIEASEVNSNTVFVSVSGYKDNDFTPHIYMTNSLGANWSSIAGDLPPLAINDLENIPFTDSVLFVATDGGIYFTMDLGNKWKRLGNNMPMITVYDVEVDFNNRRLAAGTFGRSIQTISIDSILPNPSVSAFAGDDDSICLGETVVLSATGGSTFAWSPSQGLSCTNCPSPIAGPASTTSYQVIVSNQFGVSDTDLVTVLVYPQPTASFIFQQNDTLWASVNTNYQWFFNGTILTGDTLQFIVPNLEGDYSVSTTNEFECQTVSSDFLFQFSGVSGIRELDLAIGPNPVQHKLKLNCAGCGQLEYKVFDSKGRTIHKGIATKDTWKIDAAPWDAGIYILNFTRNQESQTFRIFKR